MDQNVIMLTNLLCAHKRVVCGGKYESCRTVQRFLTVSKYLPNFSVISYIGIFFNFIIKLWTIRYRVDINFFFFQILLINMLSRYSEEKGNIWLGQVSCEEQF